LQAADVPKGCTAMPEFSEQLRAKLAARLGTALRHMLPDQRYDEVSPVRTLRINAARRFTVQHRGESGLSPTMAHLSP